MSRSRPQGQLAIVLHTHMPYVEGFGTWPFGEEWLWEAIAGSYLPLLDLLDEGAPITVSLTPVLCDQLEADGVGERFEAFIDVVRRRTHEEDIEGLRENGFDTLARELERSWGEYEQALRRFRERGGDLIAALRPACAVDVLGDARGVAAGGDRRGRARAGAGGRGFPPGALRRALGWGLLAAGVRPRASFGAFVGGGRRTCHVCGVDQPPRSRLARLSARARR